jgi:hypothetical protein
MNERDDQFELPSEIRTRLAQQDRAASLLTPDADRSVIESARRQFAASGARGGTARRWAAPAVAATLIIALSVLIPYAERGRDLPAVADDVDGSGRVDILDAFALARARESTPDAVDERTVQSLARRIVALNGGGASL